MQNVEEPVTKKIEFCPIGNGNENTNYTPETVKYDSQTKRSSFTKKLAAMVGRKLREKEEVTTVTEKSKTFGTVSAITTKSNQEKEQVTEGTAGQQNERAKESKVPLVELGDLMTRVEQVDKKLKCGEEDRQELEKEFRHNKSEYLDNYFVLAKATEEKLQQMADAVDTTDKEREKHIKKDMEEIK